MRLHTIALRRYSLRLNSQIAIVKIALNFLPALFGAGTLLFLAPSLAQDFLIATVSLDESNRPRLEFEGDTNSYYVLYRGYTVTNVTTPIVLKFGTDANGVLVDAEPFDGQSATRFFRIRKIPLVLPMDTDGDGIDDLYEVARPNILNPLNAADGGRDPDSDDLTNAEEYGLGTNPSDGDSDGDGWIDGIERGDETNPLNTGSRPQQTLLAHPPLLVELPSADAAGTSGIGLVLARPPLLMDVPSADVSGASGQGVVVTTPPVALDVPSPDAAGVTGVGVLFLARPPVLIDLPSAEQSGATGAPLLLSSPLVNIRLNSQ